MTKNNDRLNEFLKYSEVECRCGCGFKDLNPNLANMFYHARIAFGEPIIVTSGCRCKKWNADPKVGGKPDSQHLKGNALDLTCYNPTSFNLIKLAFCLGKAGFNVLGINEKKKFLHVDMRNDFMVFNY